MTRYARNDGYLGLARQTAKGTPATVSTHFVKWSGAPTQTPQQDFTRYNEGGDSQYPGITLKHLHRPDGSFSALARPKVAALLFGLLLGKQVSTGAVEAGGLSTTLASRLQAGLPYAHLTSATGLAATDILEVGAASDTELRTVSAVLTTAAVGTTTLTGNHAAGVTALVVGSSTGIIAGDFVTIGAGATLEVHKVATIVDATNITITDGLVNAQAGGVAVVEVTNVATLDVAVSRSHAAAAAAVEREAPYTHAFTPCAIASQPWASIERCLADLLVNRHTDVRIQSVKVGAQAGQPAMLEVNYLSIDETRAVSAQSDTYETDDPFIFWQGAYTIDGTVVTTKVTAFELTITNIYDEADQTSEIIRADIPLIRRDVEASWTMVFDAIAEYAATYLSAVAGTDPTTSIRTSTGSLIVDLTFGTGTSARELKIEVPNLYHTVAAVELDAGSTEKQVYACQGHVRKVTGAELVTVTVKNGEVARYCDA